MNNKYENMDQFIAWSLNNKMPWMNKALAEFKKMIDVEERNAGEDIATEQGTEKGFFYLNLHLLTGEFMNWLPYIESNVKFNSSRGTLIGMEHAIRSFFEQKVDLKDDAKKRNIGELATVFAALDAMLHEMDADINNTPLYLHIDFHSWQVYEKISTDAVRLFLINIRLVRLDALFMISTSLNELLEHLNGINTEIQQLGVLKGGTQTLADITRDKVNFLFRKTLLAKQRLMKKNISTDDEFLLKQILKPEKYDLQFLQFQIKHSRTHYTRRITESTQVASAWEKINTDNHNLKMDEYHSVITNARYITDTGIASLTLEKTRDQILKIIRSKDISATTFDNLALQTLWTYLHSAMIDIALKDAVYMDLECGIKNAKAAINKIIKKKKRSFLAQTKAIVL